MTSVVSCLLAKPWNVLSQKGHMVYTTLNTLTLTHKKHAKATQKKKNLLKAFARTDTQSCSGQTD